MAKFYYNGVLLPEIPQDVLANYPYAWIRKNTTSGYYDLIMSSLPFYYGDGVKDGSSNYNLWYRILISGSNTVTDWGTQQSHTYTGWGIDSARTVFWSNHDIYQVSNSIPTIYFESTELVPEIAEDVSWYQIKRSTLESFGDEARRLNGGTTLPLTTSQMLDILKNVNGGISGITNGYDVMFYDENNEGLAFYSIKQGHSINAPAYQVKSWQTSDGQSIAFPYTPTGDLILYANNSTYASQLFNFYGIDSGVYPYIGIVSKSGDTLLGFAKEIRQKTGFVTIANGYWGCANNHDLYAENNNDIDKFIAAIMDNITLGTLNTGAMIDIPQTSATNFFNFNPTELGYTIDGTYIDLNQ